MLFASRPDFPSGLRVRLRLQMISPPPGRSQSVLLPTAVAQVLLISGEDGARQRMAEQLAELSYEGELADPDPGWPVHGEGPPLRQLDGAWEV